MKKIITLITIIFLVYNVSFAQNTIAKLKFEEAEEAYSLNNYELTLSKIKEVEGLLKSTNPKLLYLKICAQAKIIQANPYEDLELLNNIKTLSAKYLNDYENLPDNEEKYRDIYKISESMAQYTKQGLDEHLKKIQDAAEAKKIEDLNRIKNADQNFMSYVYFKDFPTGLTLKETVRRMSMYNTHKMNEDYTQNKGEYEFSKYGYMYGNTRDLPSDIYIKNKNVIGWSGNITPYGSYESEKVQNAVSGKRCMDLKNELNAVFNFNCTESKSISGNETTITYIWEKNNKKVTLTDEINIASVRHILRIFIIDQNLSKVSGETPKKSSSGLIGN